MTQVGVLFLAITTFQAFTAEAAPQQASNVSSPKKLALRIDRVECIKPTRGVGEGKNEIQISAIVVKTPRGSVATVPIWDVGKFGKGDVKRPNHQLIAFDLPTTHRFQWTYQIVFLMADRDNGGFSAYIKELKKKAQGEIAERTKGGTSVEEVVEKFADLLGYGWAVDVLRSLSAYSGDEILDPPPMQKLAIRSGAAIDETPKTVRFTGYGGQFKVTYSWHLVFD